MEATTVCIGIVLVIVVMLAWWAEVPRHAPDVSNGPQYIRAHHSAITNTHRFIYYCLAGVPGNPYGIPVVGDTSRDPPSDGEARVTIGGSTSTIPYVSEFDRILGYLYGLTDTPYTRAIYTDVFGLPPGAVTSDCVVRVVRDGYDPTFIDISGIVLPRDLTTVSIQTPAATYTVTVTGRSLMAPPSIHGILRWNQGDLGSCAAVSVATLIAHATGKVVSPLAIYYHARGGSPVDTGTTFADVVEAVRKYGVVSESQFPYDPTRFTVRPPPGHCLDADLVVVDTPECAKRHLDAGRPVAIATTLSTSALGQTTLWNGMIPWKGSRTTGHVVVAVGYYGYGTHNSGFIVDMNWEPWWGMRGLGALPSRYFESGLVVTAI